MGEARNVAVRLKDVAEPGQVVCTEATHRLLQGQFECASLGSRKIKGVAQPVELFRVQAVAPVRNPIETAGPAGLTPLTGRDHEISLLKDRWEQAQEGMGQVVLLIGEPGLGKSRLVHTLKEHVLGQMVEGEVDAPVIEWRCSPHYQNTGLYPAIDFYERALAFGREEPPQARFDRLLHRLEQYDLARPETVPLWASLLSLPTPDRFPPLVAVAGPAAGRDVPGHAGVAAHARRPEAGPVRRRGPALGRRVHPGVPGAVPRRGPARPILTLLTFRPEFQTPWPAVAHQTSLALNRLTRRQVGDLMRKKAGAAVPEAVIEQVYDRTGGVPLFVEEFTKMVQESGALRPGGGRRLAGRGLAGARDPHHAPGPGDGPAGPDGGRAGGGPARRGPRPRVQPRAARRRRDLDEPTLQAELAKLAQAEILYPKGRPPRCTYIFKHALLEDALYNALVKGKRQQFHRRIAEVLEAQFPQTVETQPELLAHHFTEAGLTEKAVGYWLKAGLRSRERAADCEAIGHLTKGLALLETLEETREHDEQKLRSSPRWPRIHRGPRLRRARSRADPVRAASCANGSGIAAAVRDHVGQWEWHSCAATARAWCGDAIAAVRGPGGRRDGARRTPERPRHADGSVVHAGRHDVLPCPVRGGPRLLREGAGRLRRP